MATSFEKHPLIVGGLVIILFPIVFAVGTYLAAKSLFAHGRKKLAMTVIIIGSTAAIAGATWWIANSGHDDAPTYNPAPQPTARAWLSPDGTGGNCAWFPGQASDYGDPYVFCGYPAP
jgi:hypothetical protein